MDKKNSNSRTKNYVTFSKMWCGTRKNNFPDPRMTEFKQIENYTF